MEFKDPQKVLAVLRWMEQNLPLDDLPDNVRNLRTRNLRPILEMRQAALFSYGMSVALQTKVEFAMTEKADYDVMCTFVRDGERVFAPVQLKEIVPALLNPESTFQIELEKLKKYGDSKDLIVAFHLNRRCKLNIAELVPPQGVVAEIWVVAATAPDLTAWTLMGNILDDRIQVHSFVLPEPQNPAA